MRDLIHTDCYTGFDVIEGKDGAGELKLTLVGHWEHKEDNDYGMDEIADFLVTEYSNVAALRAKAEWIAAALRSVVNKTT